MISGKKPWSQASSQLTHLDLLPAVEPRGVDLGDEDLQPLGDLVRAPAHTQDADVTRFPHAVLFPV